MTKGPGNAVVGDSKMTPLRAEAPSLREAAELPNIPVNSPPSAVRLDTKESARAVLGNGKSQANKPLTCRQNLWLTFFFDGTGNNLEADLGLLRHSNVARLYRVHRPTDPVNGIFRFYVPGIGTYFREVRDDGGSVVGNAFGAMGQARLDFALKQFDATLARPLELHRSAPNILAEVNIAVFGFSRGAALARAFVSLLMETKCVLTKRRWKLKSADVPVNFRFMGLFDTVASVGHPMSSNNTDYINPALSDVAGMIEERLEDYPDTSPQALAFFTDGSPGADPAPGKHAGHDAWGARMSIHESVMEVRHFIAAHEVRNSFPADSISIASDSGIHKPAHFYETVYPGSHSDVGGGYAPGEGAKAILPSENFCLIPLRHMYEHALRQNVPLLPITSPNNVQDFEVSDGLKRAYDRYLKEFGGSGGVGQLMNKHRELYLAWRFSSIRKKRNGAGSERTLINEFKKNYREQEKIAASDVAKLQKEESVARAKYDLLVRARQIQPSPVSAAGRTGDRSESELATVEVARKQYLEARDNRLKAEAKRNAVPSMENYEAMLSLYDRQLENDVQSILSVLSDLNGKSQHRTRKNLRPHYKALLKAYEDEFRNNCGLSDPDVIAFFELYIHDSLAGFAKDATIPSDPRVVYVGGDRKLQFARANMDEERVSHAA
jgi:hypothetical protein